jgi:hypothetical protein
MTMFRSFAVSVGDEKIGLNDQGRGETSFTVTNNSTRPVRGRARLVPLGATQTEWLKVGGEPERAFPAGGTHNFIVFMDVPAGTKPGRYTFRLDVLSTADPQEDFTEGPVVAADVPETKENGSTFPWWILVAAVAIVAVGVTAYFLFRGDSEPVEAVLPPVLGLSEAEAQTKLEGLCEPRPCLQVAINTEPNGDVPKGQAVRTEPPAETRVARGADVGLVISGGPATVILRHDVFDVPEATAKQLLTTLCEPEPCVTVNVLHEGHAEVSNGRAIRTSPPKGSAVSPGSTVMLVISRVISSGQRALQRQETLDLDDGTLRGPSSQADLWLNANAGVLEPGLDAGRPGRTNRFVAFGHTSPLGPEGCATRAASPTVSQAAVPLAQFSRGVYGCIVTTQNNIAEIQIVSKTQNALSVEYKTWPQSKKGLSWWDSRIIRDAGRVVRE